MKLNPADFEGYGSEMTLMVNTINTIADENQYLKGQAQVINEDKFFEKLEQLVPDWEAINADARWLDWLKQPDPISGIQRQLLLSKARTQYDVRRVVEIFNQFKTSPVHRDNNHVNMNSQPIVTREQYNKAARDCANGRITAEEFDRITVNFQQSIRTGSHTDGFHFTEAENPQGQGITRQEYDAKVNDFLKGRISENEINRISDLYQNQIIQAG